MGYDILQIAEIDLGDLGDSITPIEGVTLMLI